MQQLGLLGWGIGGFGGCKEGMGGTLCSSPASALSQSTLFQIVVISSPVWRTVEDTTHAANVRKLNLEDGEHI